MNVAGAIAFHAGKAIVSGAVHAMQEHEHKQEEKKKIMVVVLVLVKMLHLVFPLVVRGKVVVREVVLKIKMNLKILRIFLKVVYTL